MNKRLGGMLLVAITMITGCAAHQQDVDVACQNVEQENDNQEVEEEDKEEKEDSSSTYTIVKDEKGNCYLKDDGWGDGWEYIKYTAYNNGFEEKAYAYQSVAAFRHMEEPVDHPEPEKAYRINEKEAKEKDFQTFSDQTFSEEAKLISFEPLKFTFEDFTERGKPIVQKASKALIEKEDLDSELRGFDSPLYVNDEGKFVLKDRQIKDLLFNGLGTSLLKGDYGSMTTDGDEGYTAQGLGFTLYAETVDHINSISIYDGEVLGARFTQTPEQVRDILGTPKEEAVMENTGLYTQCYERDTYELLIEYGEDMSIYRIVARPQ